MPSASPPRTPLQTLLRWTVRLLAALIVLLILLVAAGQAGLFAGTAPDDLGVRDGRLKAPSHTPNSVSSQARLHADHPRRDDAWIAPLPLAGGGPTPIERIAEVVASMPGARIVEQRPDYLYAQFTSRWFGFVDDVEFWADGRQVQVRSASRIGRGDRGVNRARIEAVRERLRAPG